jgi:NAD(P)H-hydrate epimerase
VGAGNNGGDGYVIAALAAQRNIPVRLYELGDSSKYSEETQRARQFALESQVDLTAFNDHIELSEGVVVDSLLGTGGRGELRQPFRQAVDLINSAGLPVLSVDIPSGLNADTGAVEDSAVKADLTVTFIAGKKGLFTGRGTISVWRYCLSLPRGARTNFSKPPAASSTDGLIWSYGCIAPMAS